MLNFYLDPSLSVSATNASLLAAKAVNRNTNHARNLRAWITDFVEYDILPFHLLGRFDTSKLEDEDYSSAIHQHLLSICRDQRYIGAQDIVDFCQSDQFKEVAGKTIQIHVRTARRWLKKSEWRYGKDGRGMYIDGHERQDVVKYRSAFVARWKDVYEPRMFLYDRDGTKIQDPATDLLHNKKRIILYTHDESTFYANDRRKTKWHHPHLDSLPQPKGEGESLMVSDFLSPEFGRLKKDDQEARVLFRAGNSRDGYFTNDDIINQVLKAIDIFEDKHGLHNTALFVFDNATTHLKRPDDGLSARKMVLNPHPTWTHNPGGPRMRPGRLPNNQLQEFYFPPDHPVYPNFFKGMRQILIERNLWRDKLRAECKGFKCDHGAVDCCARRILFNQPDFVGQKSRLEEIIERNGHLCDFYPKFHCELNFIEQYWGAAKRAYRSTKLTSSTDEMERNVIHSLDSVPLDQIRRYVPCL
ncbi:hypothetical protein SISNIDRAFT_407601 [Sistotremastrum niveocremeum HHB9708]|uniref:Tc1-like transposase DDE domain-containing protein n=1 Tax=Sistotremastrum niveocremeum HHB9708 TaxID=1314777 RepID=A0A164Q3E3_9AGAM|nr:hypothetical protein SISNIDRAFT_416985 [Sistotremastrum niveocremeum HHB9708]KZS96510.1 hypothetical protein SISNIDRAFT_407601 [Sistotremastrum niveocremeum HHB9708]